MGSLEEERFVQMVHDFIESESSAVPAFSSSSKCLSIDHQAEYFTLQVLFIDVSNLIKSFFWIQPFLGLVTGECSFYLKVFCDVVLV